MCDPITITAGVLAAVSTTAQIEQASANAKAIENQSVERGREISQQAGQQATEAAMQAREARAQSIVAAGASGINLGSNSFLSSLQTTAMHQSNEEGVILENEKNQQAANVAETNTNLVEKASSPTFLGAAANIGSAAGSEWMSEALMTKAGALRAS